MIPQPKPLQAPATDESATLVAHVSLCHYTEIAGLIHTIIWIFNRLHRGAKEKDSGEHTNRDVMP
jgi:hypothetical protein